MQSANYFGFRKIDCIIKDIILIELVVIVIEMENLGREY